MSRFLFWVCCALSLTFASLTVYLGESGVRCPAGTLMAAYFLVLAWAHSRRAT